MFLVQRLLAHLLVQWRLIIGQRRLGLYLHRHEGSSFGSRGHSCVALSLLAWLQEERVTRLISVLMKIFRV